MLRKATTMAAAAAADRRVTPMLGHLQHGLEQIEHLSPLLDHRRHRTALRQRVIDNHVGRLDALQRGAAMPGLPAGLRPPGCRNDFGVLASPSEEGGLLELWLSLLNRASNSRTRAHNVSTVATNCFACSNSARISASFSATLSRDRSGTSCMT